MHCASSVLAGMTMASIHSVNFKMCAVDVTNVNIYEICPITDVYMPHMYKLVYACL